MSSIDSDRYQPHGSEYCQVLRHLRLAESKSVNEIADGGLVRPEGVKQCTSAAVSNRVECVSRRRKAGHLDIICRYGYVSTASSPTNPSRRST